jgi:tetratricopeptide (TPR) repeat protein
MRGTERYDRKLEDIFSVQDDVTKSVATALAVELTEGDTARISSRQTSSLEAYEYYLQAENLPKFSPESNEKGKELLKRALTVDPNFLAAIVELAWKHTFDARFGWTDDVAGAWARAEALNEQALAIDPESGQALHLAGYLSLYRDGDYERGVRIAGEAATLEPGNFQARAGYGWLLLAAMRSEKAVNEFEHALRLSPKRPLWVAISTGRRNTLAKSFSWCFKV